MDSRPGIRTTSTGDYEVTMHEWFWDKVHKTNSCWYWEGCKNPKGYGLLGPTRPERRAHRFSWMIHNSVIPNGLQVCHTCDNPSCVNPEHLFLGTNYLNHLDKVNKKRHRHLSVSLHKKVVKESAYKTRKQIALDNNISLRSVFNILSKEVGY
jgi:hypothetical protein